MVKAKWGTLDFKRSTLTGIFESLGASGVEGWVHSQQSEQIPQLSRFLFLRSAWKFVLGKGEIEWIDEIVDETPADSNEPFAGIGYSLRRLLAAGADRRDLAEFVRNVQAEMLSEICDLLDDSRANADDWPEDVEERLDGFGWSLFETDADERPLHGIGGLHEGVLQTDPSGDEMRPFGSEPS